MRRWWSVLLCVALVASMSGFATAGAKTATPEPIAKTPVGTVSSGSGDVVADKLDTRLGTAVQKAKDKAAKAKYVDVAVLVAEGSKAPKGLERAIKLSLRADPTNDVWVGRAKVGALVKMASAKQVTRSSRTGAERLRRFPKRPPRARRRA